MTKRRIGALLLGVVVLCTLAAARAGGDIAAGTITGDRIAARTITASNLNVLTLSAITGDVGTLTGGTIDGVTINAGSGDEVVLNSSGVTFTAGTAANNKVKWSDGNAVFSDSNSLQMSGLAGGTTYVRSNGDVAIEAGLDSSGIVVLAAAAPPRVSNFSGLGSTSFVCHDNSGNLYSSATTCDGSAPAPSAAHVAALEREVAALRAAIEQLAAQR